jgi:hypothetical protein
MKPRSWVAFPSLRGVLIGAQVVLAVMALAGAVCLVVGGKALVDSRRFAAKASAANAVVVDVAEVVRRVQKRSGDNWYDEDVTYFHPVLRFVTTSEQTVQVQASEGSEDPSAHRVGDSVRILYDPANPQDARLDTWFSRWGEAVVLSSIGFGLVLLPAVIFLVLIGPRLRAARGGGSRPSR